MTSEPGLRERKKAATRAALSHAAWTLLLEHGLDAVTPETIAEAADVSPRTFRNYFASREEAIVDALAQRYVTLADKIGARPAGETVWNSLEAVLCAEVPEVVGDRDKLAVLMRVMTESPALRAQLLLVTQHLSDVMARVIAARTGTDAERDLRPRLLADAVGTAIGTSVGFWARTGTDTPLSELIRDCLAQLRAGLPIGATAPAD
ncbi:transcriptional regulator, TetR family [Micromonospora pattaloongensis]|uniref:Transcriptional regulator, TetR family n=1 Tax=Micromonospora pattaloongensis TaxID=405436 RepID=A0A1H3QS23_9ACTN|nr:TetR/AcrR family transcriptional regulator [Micromonospora pattaloongensis]SDZ16130.1 transcriptional regulator, TetR family [Micromonospora pattaloongensis]